MSLQRNIVLPLLLALSTAAMAKVPSTSDEATRVAAFARLYGVVRYFHPGDALQSVDWNRFAVYGTTRVQAAHDSAELGATLKSLFTPLGSGILVLPDDQAYPAAAPAAADEARVRWQRTGYADGIYAARSYQAKRTNRPGVLPINGPAVLTQKIDATALRGKTLRFRARLRVQTLAGDGEASLQMAVQRATPGLSVHVSTRDQPVRTSQWQTVELVGTADGDATTLSLGMRCDYGLAADIADATLEQRAADGSWQPVAALKPLETPHAWQLANAASTVQSTPMHATGGETWLRVDMRAAPELTAAAHTLYPLPKAASRFADFPLGDGWKARVPLDLSDREARATPVQQIAVDTLNRQLAALPDPARQPIAPAVRQADLLVAWNVLRHFSPYWVDLDVDWDAQLVPLLETATQPADRSIERDSLRHLVALAQDGHGSVHDLRDTGVQMALLIAIEPIGDDWVVTASDVPDQARTGDVITAVDGQPIAAWKARQLALSSGTLQWRTWASIIGLVNGPAGKPVTLGLLRDGKPRQAALRYDGTRLLLWTRPDDLRPAPLAELKPGIWYVDMTRCDPRDFDAKLPELAAARGVVIDLRGYPMDGMTFHLMPHLLRAPDHHRWMHVPSFAGPFGQLASVEDVGWDMLAPKAPRLAGHLVFLADGRSISQADSILGFVTDDKLADLVGSTSAGTNGDVNGVETPAGFMVTFTGLRVTRHDGHSRFHLLGATPTVEARPTLAGFRSGRDEVLERALQLLH